MSPYAKGQIRKLERELDKACQKVAELARMNTQKDEQIKALIVARDLAHTDVRSYATQLSQESMKRINAEGMLRDAQMRRSQVEDRLLQIIEKGLTTPCATSTTTK